MRFWNFWRQMPVPGAGSGDMGARGRETRAQRRWAQPTLRAAGRRRRAFFEALEPRLALATIVVTRMDDEVGSGDGMTLREAIAEANTNGTAALADVIEFAPGLAGTILLGGTGQLEIRETVIIRGNGATNTIIDAHGGSRVIEITSTAGDVTFEGVTITGGNTADIGGGIASKSAGVLTVNSSAIHGNSVAISDAVNGGGGGIGTTGNSPVIVINSTISGNSVSTGPGAVAAGGGIGVFGSATVIGSTISLNSVSTTGDGMFATSGGIGVGGFTTIRNSIIAGNSDIGGQPDLGAFSGLTLQASLIGDNSGTGLTASAIPDVNGNIIGGAGAAKIDPLLGPLAFNGGVTKTHALLAGSPAANRGKINHEAALKATPNLRALYRLNENFGSIGPAADSGGGGFNGMYASGVMKGLVNSLETGDGGNTLGNAAGFDGVDDQILLPAAVVPAGGFTDFSLSFWVNTTQQNGATTNWFNGQGLVDGSGGGLASDFGTSLLGDKFAFGLGSPDTTVKSAQTINDGQWHHVVATRVSFNGAMAVYVDGVLGGTASGPTGARTATTQLAIGALQTGANFFAGQLDEVAIFTRALGAGEVASLYQAEVPPANDQRGDPFPRVFGPRDMGAFEQVQFQDPLLVVDTAVDENDGDLSSGDLSLREAIALANGILGTDLITFSPLLDGQPILLTLGQLEIRESVTIQGNGAGNTIIDGQQQSRVFDVLSTARDVTLDGVTITGGKVTNGDGGGIRSQSIGVLQIHNAIVSQNTVVRGNGGGIWRAGELEVMNSTLSGNLVNGRINSGGDNGEGGAIWGSLSVRITGSTISGNNVIVDGRAKGGGVFAQGFISVIDSTITNNRASAGFFTAEGGGAFSNEVVTVTNSTISGNRAVLEFFNPLGQQRMAAGGGIAATKATIVQSTIAFNTVDAPVADVSKGGGLSTTSNATIHNSIVAGNTDADGSHPDFSAGGAIVVKNSLIGDNSGTGLTPSATPDAIDGNIVGGAGAAKIDPKLGPLMFNGGVTKTHALPADSPAIDGGSNLLANVPRVDGIPDDEVPLTMDQRGTPFTRTANGRPDQSVIVVDMGAYERVAATSVILIVDTSVDENDGNYAAGDLSLREAIGLANGSVGANVITFVPALDGQPILLTLGQLEISETVTVRGNGAANTIIDGQQQSRVFDVLATGGDVTFEGVTVRNGRTTVAGFSEGGGGIRSLSNGTLTIQNSTLTGNATTGANARGGAIFAERVIAVTSSTISDNSAASSGGGIASPLNTVTVTNSTISGNEAAGDGGGIRAAGVIAVNSTFSGNRALRGGGMLVDVGGAIVINSTITDNTATADGGGVFTSFSSGSITLRNSIVAGNSDAGNGRSPDLFDLGNINAQSSLIGVNSSVVLNPAPVGLPDANGNVIGTLLSPIDPKLGPLAFNGGPTQTHALLPGSPAINAGSNALAKTAGPDGIFGNGDDVALTTDQRGVPFDRILGGRVDIGAFELRALVVNTNADENDATFDAADLSLREALVVANANASFEPYTIVFSPLLNGQTITLTLGELLVTTSMAIVGPGADKLAISGGSGATQSRVFIFDGGGPQTYSLSGVTVQNGNGLGKSPGFGGAIRFVGADDGLLIADSVIRDSSALIGGDSGGGLYADRGRLDLTNVTVMNNIADFGGGLGFLEVSGILTNVTVSGNTANTRGGGIEQIASRVDGTSQLLLINSTVTANVSAIAAGVRTATQNSGVESTLFLANTIVANNTGGGAQFVKAGTGGSIVSFGNNISSDGTGDLFQTSDKPNMNPMLGALANNGGPVPTHVVPFGSPAHDAGDNSLAIFLGPDGTPFTPDDVPLFVDARGAPRIFPSEGTVDIGAFEFVPNQAPTFSLIAGFGTTDEAGATVFPAAATSISPGLAIEVGQILEFDVSVLAAEQGLFDVLPTIGPTGTLTFTPKPNQKGTATVTVVLSDNAGTDDGGDDTSFAETFEIVIDKPHPWHNSSPGAFGSLDVNGKDGITVLDAVMVISYLNSASPAGEGDVPASAFTAPPGVPSEGYIDVAIDGTNANFISVLDALLVINRLNSAGGEGEGGTALPPATTAFLAAEPIESASSQAEFADLLQLLAIDLTTPRSRRRA